MFVYKIDILKALKEKGYTTYYIRKNKVISESSLTMIRQNKIVSIEVFDKLCDLLECDISKIIEYKKG